MNKSFFFLIIPALILSCKQKENIFYKDNPKTAIDLPLYDTSIVFWKKNNNTDSVLKYIDLKCRQASVSGNVKQLVQTKYDAYNYLYEKNDLIRAGEYADYILTPGERLILDTSLLDIVIKVTGCRGLDMEELGQHNAAADLMRKYISLTNQYKKSYSRIDPYIFHALGITYTRYGDYKRACDLFDKENRIWLLQRNFENAASTVFNRCIALREIRETDSAIGISKDAIGFPAISSKRKAILYLTMAECYLDKAEIDSCNYSLSLAGSQLGMINDSSVYAEKISDWYKLKGEISLRKNSLLESIILYKKALFWHLKTNAKLKNRETGKFFYQLAKAYLKKNKPDSAIYYYHHALYTVTNIDTSNIFSLPSKQELYAENTIMDALDAKAEWMTKYYTQNEKLKYWNCAVDCYDLAFEVERKLLQNFSYDESKIGMLKQSRQRSEKAIALCYKLYQETKDNKWIEKAFWFAERNKSFIVLESIKRNLAASQIAQHDTLFQKVQQWQMEYAYAEKSLLEAKISNDTAQVRLSEENKKKADEQLQLATISLNQNNIAYRQWMEQEDSISLSSVNELLPDNKTFLIEYFIGDSTSYAFAISKNQPAKFIAIDNTDLSQIDSLLFFFRNKNNIINDPRGYQLYANKVYQSWISPCLGGISGKNIIIIPDDKLTILPFDALITNISKDNDLRSWSYLVKEYQIDLGYSVAALLKQKSRTVNYSGAVAFAPGFANRERNLPPLPFTADEADNIRKISNAKVYKNKEAALTQFRTSAPVAGIIHIASHARADSTEAGCSIDFADSTFYLNELYAMQLNASLVVLSACETGIGKIEKGEGPMSLARGFYYAGAKNIITSLWSINDQSTAMLFKSFYDHAGSGKYGQALYQSKINYLSSELFNDKYSPYYWAGFVYIGSDNKKEGSLWLWLSGSAIIIMLSGALLYWYRRNKKRIKHTA